MKIRVAAQVSLAILLGFLWWCPALAQTSIELVAGHLERDSSSVSAQQSFSRREATASLNSRAIDLLSTGRPVPALSVSLFPNTVFDLRGTETDVHLARTIVNKFSILGDLGGSAILSVTDGVLYGTITTGANTVYRIRREADGLYTVEELDQSKFPDCETEPGPGSPSTPGHPPPSR